MERWYLDIKVRAQWETLTFDEQAHVHFRWILVLEIVHCNGVSTSLGERFRNDGTSVDLHGPVWQYLRDNTHKHSKELFNYLSELVLSYFSNNSP